MNLTTDECSLYTWLMWPPVENGETAIIGIRGPVTEKYNGYLKAES
jgi:hypothetical protein